MSLKEIWERMNEAWYGVLDSLDDRGIHVYKIVDPLESKGIPSLAAFIGLIVLIIIIAGFWAMPRGPGVSGPGTLIVSIKSGGKALEGANIAITLNGESIGTWKTGPDGKVKIEMNKTGKLAIQAYKNGCESIQKISSFNGGMSVLSLSMNCTLAPTSCTKLSDIASSIQILGPGMEKPKNCRAYMVSSDGTSTELDWNILDDGTMIFGDDCLQNDSQIRIECSGLVGTFTLDEIDEKSSLGESLVLSPTSPDNSGDLNGNGTPDWEESSSNQTGNSWDNWGDGIDDNQNGIPDSQEADNWENSEDLIKLNVFVYDQVTNSPLSGIEIRAVSGGDTITSGTTSSGYVLLEVPPENISLQAIDPSGTYAAYQTDEFNPDQTKTKKIFLENGRLTRIRAIQPDGRGIRNAEIIINNIITFTNSQGIATISLRDGSYTAYAWKDGYKPGKATVDAGSEANITLERLNDTNSGPVKIEMVNPTRMDDPFPGVNVRLESDDGMIQCNTGRVGYCSMQLYSTTYEVYAKPPMTTQYQDLGQIQVKPGTPNIFKFEVYPPKMEITVRTLVNGIPENADVKLYHTYPDIELEDSGSSQNSYITLDAYWGNEYYLTASYENETTTLYGYYGPFKVTSSKEIEMNLEPPKTNVSVDAPGSANRGARIYADVNLGLPYMDQRRKIPYDSIKLDLWVGGPGSKDDPMSSPILIDRLNQLIHFSEASQIPKIALESYDSYSSGLSGSTDPATETSKGIELTMKNYNVGTFTFRIPLLVRIGALSNNATIHYKVDYTSSSSQYSTGWMERNITLLGRGNWHKIKSGPFYIFRSGLSTDPNSTEWEDKLDTTKGSEFYLHVLALARDYTKDATIDVDVNPEIAEPVYFFGRIMNRTKSWEIEKTETTGSLDVLENTLKQGLEPDDRVSIVLAIKARSPGVVSIVPFSSESEAPPLIVDIKNVSWTPTPLSGVEAAVIPEVHVTNNDLPKGHSADEWVGFKKELPLYSQSRSMPREFRINVILNSTSDYEGVNLAASSGEDLGLDYPDTINIHQGTNQFTISGTGPDSPSNGEIDIWIWQNGSEKPSDPWLTIPFGPDDFFINISSNPGMLADELSSVSTNATVSGRDDAGILGAAESASLAGVPARASYSSGEKEFVVDLPELTPGSNADAVINWPNFTLKRAYKVEGISINPDSTIFDSTTLQDSHNSSEQTLYVVNNWKTETDVEADVLDYLTGDSASPENYRISVTADIYDQNGNLAPPENQDVTNGITLEPGQVAIITWNVTALGSAANNENLTLDLNLTFDNSETGITTYKDYIWNISSSFAIPTPTPPTVLGYGNKYFVERESDDPEGEMGNPINSDTSCIATINSSGLLENARICDSEQMASVIKDLIGKLGHNYYITGGPYALGKDSLALSDLKQLLPNTEINSMKVNGEETPIMCGILNITVEKPKTGGYDIIVEESDKEMPWCSPRDPSFFMGLLNDDRGATDVSTMLPYKSSNLDEIEENEKIKDNLVWLLGYSYGYSSGFSTSVSKTNNYYTINWYNVKLQNIGPGSNSNLQWVRREMENNEMDIAGFIRWYPKSSQMYPMTYDFGIVYNKDLNPNTVKSLKDCWIENLFFHWIFGNRSYINETKNDIKNGLVINLDGCQPPDMQALTIPKYDFVIKDSHGDITNGWTNFNGGESDIYITLKDYEDVSYCYAWIDGYDKVQFSPNAIATLSAEDLGDGQHNVSVYCVSKTGVAGKTISKPFNIDTRAPSLYIHTPLVSFNLGVCQKTYTLKFTVEDHGSGLKECHVTSSSGEILKNCDISNEETPGMYDVSCKLGNNDNSFWKGNDVKELLGMSGSSGCIPLPVFTTLNVTCSDSVSNTASKTLGLSISGQGLDVGIINNQKCPVLSGTDILENSKCLFTDLESDSSQAAEVNGQDITYYTNANQQDLHFYVYAWSVAGGIQCFVINKDTNKQVDSCQQTQDNCGPIITSQSQLTSETWAKLAANVSETDNPCITLNDTTYASYFECKIPGDKTEGKYKYEVECLDNSKESETGVLQVGCSESNPESNIDTVCPA